MTLYRIAYMPEEGTSSGFEWVSSLVTANKAKRRYLKEHPDSEPTVRVEQIVVNTTKKGLLLFLNRYASHPDNG